MEKKDNIKNLMVMGFALFAMFFGAGNLIFPPYLGFGSASNWFCGFLAFIVTDIGLAVFALLMIAKKGKGSAGITEVLGEKWSLILLTANTICLGPLIAIPRTGATTFEFAVQPIFPSYINTWVAGAVFFALVIVFSLKQNKIMDIIGTFLTPIMLAALALLILKGILSPLGMPAHNSNIKGVLSEGIKAGYQTMDMMGALIFSVSLMTNIEQKGYKQPKQKAKMIMLSGMIASLGLFAVYCGLAYLGASASTVYPTNFSQAELLIAITKGILGQSGVVLLGIIVAAACLTTAIGLVASSAAYFNEITHDKLKYTHLVIGISILSYIVSNAGISKIIQFAGPILDIIYPVLLVLTFMALFSEKISNFNIYKGAALGALATSILTLAKNLFGLNLGIDLLPLADMGFAWVLPALIGGLIGGCIKKNAVKNQEEAKIRY